MGPWLAVNQTVAVCRKKKSVTTVTASLLTTKQQRHGARVLGCIHAIDCSFTLTSHCPTTNCMSTTAQKNGVRIRGALFWNNDWQSLGIIQNHSLYSKITSKIQIKVRKVIGMLNLLYLLHLKTKNCTEDTKDQVINWWTIWYSLFGPKYMGATPLPVNKFQAQRITVLTHGGYIRVGQSITYRNLQCHEA